MFLTVEEAAPILHTTHALIKSIDAAMKKRGHVTRSRMERHAIAMRRCEVRSKVLPLDQLRGLPMVTDEVDASGVYFLWYGPVLMYVGQSKYLSTRIAQHREARKRFTHATYERENEVWIRHNEKGYVLRYCPPLNMTRLG